MGTQIKIASINANGLNSPLKRKHIFYQLEKLNLDIMCSRDT